MLGDEAVYGNVDAKGRESTRTHTVDIRQQAVACAIPSVLLLHNYLSFSLSIWPQFIFFILTAMFDIIPNLISWVMGLLEVSSNFLAATRFYVIPIKRLFFFFKKKNNALCYIFLKIINISYTILAWIGCISNQKNPLPHSTFEKFFSWLLGKWVGGKYTMNIFILSVRYFNY